LIPPFSDLKSSRIIYHNLDEFETRFLLSADETAWMAVSAAIMESRQGYPDTTLIEGKNADYSV
jgi:hypothetical protein